MIDHSLPLWSTKGWDRATGGFVERLHQDGRADRLAPRRVRVQARQIYCFAKAAKIGWYPQGRENDGTACHQRPGDGDLAAGQARCAAASLRSQRYRALALPVQPI
jgi:hypothetical protein